MSSKLYTRGEFLTLLGLTGLALVGCESVDVTSEAVTSAESLPAFPQPRELRSASNGVLDVTLDVSQAKNTVGDLFIDAPTYGGQIPGPTLRVRPGDRLNLFLRNTLAANTDTVTNINIPHHPRTTNMHVHGMHVSPLSPGDNIFREVEPGSSYQYSYDIPANHPAGTFWYHPHVHGSAAVQLLSGMAGALIVEGDLDRVPEIAAARDLVMVIQQIRTGADGIQPPLADERFFIANTKAVFCVNGLINPTLALRQGEVVRLRLVNGTSNTTLPITIPGMPMLPISIDGNTLPGLKLVDSVQLAPGNRMDVLIQAGGPGSFQMTNLDYAQGGAPPLTAGQIQFVQIEISQSALPAMRLPASLPAAAPGIRDDEIQNHRQLTFEEMPPDQVFTLGVFMVDGKLFDPAREDQTIPLGAVEEWTIFNTSTTEHPFHIHINPFQVVSINGVPLPEPIWQDTVTVPKQGNVVIRHRFLDFTGPYVLHCHVLLHECVGMMQVVNVVGPTASAGERQRGSQHAKRLVASKNPTRAQLDQICAANRPIPRFRWGPPKVG